MLFILRWVITALISVIVLVSLIIYRQTDEDQVTVDIGLGRRMRVNRRAPWYNKTYNAEIEFRNYALYPLADTILTALRRQAESKHAFMVPEMWALPPFGPLRENIVIAPKYNLATCQIEKIMTTVRDAIFCYLADPRGFEANNRSMSAEVWMESSCGWSYYRSNIDDVERETKRNYLRFAIIRDPFERFLSGYVDKCLNERNFSPQVRCLGCRYDMRCFVERLFHLLYGMHHNRTYIAREVWYVARHFAPQSWQCNFKKQLKNYNLIVYPESSRKAEIISEEFDRVFSEAGVPGDMRSKIRKELLNDVHFYVLKRLEGSTHSKESHFDVTVDASSIKYLKMQKISEIVDKKGISNVLDESKEDVFVRSTG